MQGRKSVEELKQIMQAIHEAEAERSAQAKEKETALRQLVHDNIESFSSVWELHQFCKATTKTQEEFNGVYGRLLNTWNNTRASKRVVKRIVTV